MTESYRGGMEGCSSNFANMSLSRDDAIENLVPIRRRLPGPVVSRRERTNCSRIPDEEVQKTGGQAESSHVAMM